MKFLMELVIQDSGDFKFGQTISQSGYLPNENEEFFNEKQSLIDWLRQFSQIKTRFT